MDYLLFFTSSLLAFLYFFYKHRHLDIYSVAAASGILFFSTAYFGEVEGPRNYPTLPISPTLYYSFSLYFLAMLLCAWMKDHRRKRSVQSRSHEVATNHRVALLAFALWGLSAALLVAMYPTLVFSGSKREFITEAGFQQTLTMALSTLAATCMATSRISWRFAATASILVFSLLAGNRTPAALTVVACALIWGRRVGPIALFRARPVLYPIAVVVLFASGSSLKYVYSSFRAEGVVGVKGLFGSHSTGDIIVGGAEFLTTQYIFADVVESDYRTDGKHILRGWMSVLPIPRRWSGTASGEFNDLFQTELYGEMEFGMAYNPFAEFYAGAGFLGILVFIVGMQVGLYALDNCIEDRRCAIWVPVIAISGSLLAFYIHRNSVGVTFAMIRNVLWPYVFILAVCYLRLGASAAGDAQHAFWRQEESILKRRFTRKPTESVAVRSPGTDIRGTCWRTGERRAFVDR